MSIDFLHTRSYERKIMKHKLIRIALVILEVFVALGAIAGGSMLLAAATILSGREIGVLASALAGLIMMGFEVVEAAVIDRIGGSQLLFAVSLQAFYFALGLAIFVLACSIWVTEYRSYHFQARHASHV